MLEEIFLGVAIGIMFITLFLLLRNHLVYKMRSRALEVTSRKARDVIDAGTGKDWMEFYNQYEAFGEYEQQLLQIHKWTYAQFYPGWE